MCKYVRDISVKSDIIAERGHESLDCWLCVSGAIQDRLLLLLLLSCAAASLVTHTHHTHTHTHGAITRSLALQRRHSQARAPAVCCSHDVIQQ